MTGMEVLIALLLGWFVVCALAIGDVHIESRPAVRLVQPTTGAAP